MTIQLHINLSCLYSKDHLYPNPFLHNMQSTRICSFLVYSVPSKIDHCQVCDCIILQSLRQLTEFCHCEHGKEKFCYLSNSRRIGNYSEAETPKNVVIMIAVLIICNIRSSFILLQLAIKHILFRFKHFEAIYLYTSSVKITTL